MNRAEQTALAWALVDIAKPALTHEAQTWVYIKIGAGEEEESIYDLLRILANYRVVLPQKVFTPLQDWAFGYRGSDLETRVRMLLKWLRVPEPPQMPTAEHVAPSTDFEKRPRRVLHDPSHLRPLERLANSGREPALHQIVSSDEPCRRQRRPAAPVEVRS